MAKPTLKELQTKRQNKLDQITDFRKENEYYESRLANYRQGSKDVQSSISRLKRNLGPGFTWQNIQEPEIKRQALLDAMRERKRIIEYQTDDHNFVTNSHEVEAYLKKKKGEELATKPSPPAYGGNPSIQNNDDDEDVEDAASNQDEEDVEEAATSTQTSSTQGSTALPQSLSPAEKLNTDAKRSHTTQVAKMEALINAVESMDVNDNKAFQAFVDLEISQQENMHRRFERTICDMGENEIKKHHKEEGALHDEYDKILLELRDANLKVADSLCQEHDAIDHEDWPKVTKTWVFGPDNYREYSTDRHPANVIRYFSRLASTGMFNGMEFGEKSMSIDAKPTLRINEKGELELAKDASEALKNAFNDQYPNGTKTHHRRFNDIELESFQNADAENPDRNAKYKHAATERLEAKIQSLQKRQDALAERNETLQSAIDILDNYRKPEKNTPAIPHAGSLVKLKGDLQALKTCKQTLDAVKSFPMFSNKDLKKRAYVQIEQIIAAEKLLNPGANPQEVKDHPLLKQLSSAIDSKNEDGIKEAKKAIEAACKDTLITLDKNINDTTATIKHQQAQYFEYQKLQRECKQEQQECRKEQQEARKAQIIAAIDHQIVEYNNDKTQTAQLTLHDSPRITIDARGMANVAADISVQWNDADDASLTTKAKAMYHFYTKLAQQSNVAPITMWSRADHESGFKKSPFLTIDAQGEISFPDASTCPLELQAAIKSAEAEAKKATATATSAPHHQI